MMELRTSFSQSMMVAFLLVASLGVLRAEGDPAGLPEGARVTALSLFPGDAVLDGGNFSLEDSCYVIENRLEKTLFLLQLCMSIMK